MGTRHEAALLDRIVEQCERSRCPRSSTRLKTHLLKNARHAVTNLGGRCKREINDPERHSEAPRCLARNQLANTRDLECGPLDRLCNLGKVRALEILQRMLYNAGAADADIDDAVPLGNAVERSCHKGIVPRRIAEHNNLCAADRFLLTRQFRRTLDHIAHLAHGIHIDAGLRRADIYG